MTCVVAVDLQCLAYDSFSGLHVFRSGFMMGGIVAPCPIPTQMAISQL